jgi:hypothetical protein
MGKFDKGYLRLTKFSYKLSRNLIFTNFQVISEKKNLI